MSNVLRASAGSKEPVDIRGVPFRGVRPDKAPSHLEPNDFIALENVRRIGGLITNRPGQTSFSILTTGEATGMYDFQTGIAPGTGSGRGLFFTLSGGEGADMLTLNQFDPAQSPKLQARQDVTTLGTASLEMRTTRVLIEGVDNLPSVDCLVIAKNSLVDSAATVCKLEAFVSGYSIDSPQVGLSPGTLLVTLPPVSSKNYNRIDSMIQYGGKLFICATSFDETAWAVFSWDGQTCTFERALTGAFGSACAVYRDSLIVFADTNMHIRTQAGAWSTVGTGAVATSTVNPNCVEVYRDLLYFVPSGLITGTFGVVAPTPDHVPSIYSFDGTTVSIITNATTGIGDAILNKSRICGLEVFNSILYVSWGLSPGDASGVWDEENLATFDGTTWTATHVTITTGDDDKIQLPIRAFQGALYCGCGAGLMKSDKTLTDNVWSTVPITVTGFQTNLELH